MSGPTRSLRSGPRRRLALLVACAGLTGSAWAFEFISDFFGPFAAAWNPGTVALEIRMPASGPLIDGTTYAGSIQAAVNEWNAVLGTVQLSATSLGESPNSTSNGRNEIYLPSSAGSVSLGGNVLAVTYSRYSGTNIIEADIVFNPAWRWDSYRGNRSANPDRFDIRRVALHEIGHLLGLDHPDQASPAQAVSAIMNSRASNTLDALQSDDIAGAQVLYGAPGFVPANDHLRNATTITGTSFPLTLDGSNVAATKEPGEPNHAGDAGGRSVWWRWTAPSAGSVAIATLGSRFDTVLAVYTGNSVDSLSQIAANDNATAGSTRTSSVTYSATAGTTYWIAVDGASGDAASVSLTFSFATGGTAMPTLRVQPASLFASPGGTITLTVTADRASTYQWFHNGTAIPGATGSTLSLSDVGLTRVGDYTVRVTNAAGTIQSAPATVTVLSSTLPALVVPSGRTVSVSVPTSDERIQWQTSTTGSNWTNLSNDSTYSGVTSQTLTITNAGASLNGMFYRYVATGVANGGTSTSPATALTVSPLLLPLPSALTADGSGGVYVADAADHVILRVTANGEVSVVAGTRGTTGSTDGNGSAARFNAPGGLARDAQGNLYIADSGNALIRRMTADGTVTTLAGSAGSRGNQDGIGAAATFSNPTGLALDASGNLFVSDTQMHTIRKVTAQGVVTTFAGEARSAGLSDGTTGARFNTPQGLASDADGNLYVADSGNHTIRKVTPAGVVSTLAGLAGVSGSFDDTALNALFSQPSSVAITADGTLYVTDTGNQTIRRIDTARNVAAIAGLLRVSGLKDGTAREVWFNQPRGIALSADTIFVADTGNAVLRRTSSTGTVATLSLYATGSAPPSTTTPVTSTPTTPPLNPAPAPSGTASSGGGGGGAPSWWMLAAITLLCTSRLLRRNAPC